MTLRDGTIIDMGVPESGSLMEALRGAGLPVLAICGGNGICSTCHVHLDEANYSALTPPDEDELETLIDLRAYQPGRSRLACQIAVGTLPSDFRATLAPEG